MATEPDSRHHSLVAHDPAFKLLSGLPRPEFMLIGGAKCGTTSFSSYLPLHPQVKECNPKEPNFWSWKLCKREQYQRLFVNTQTLAHPTASQQIGGEYSTSYLLHPLAPRRLRARIPEVKIIVLLRNPIDRAYSHYVMASRNGVGPGCTFDEIVEREMAEVPLLLEAHQRGFLDTNFRTDAHRTLPDGTPITVVEHSSSWPRYSLKSERELLQYYVTSCLLRSVYCDQLWRWCQLFPTNQFKIIESDKLMDERRDVMDDVVEFLGLQPYDFKTAELQHTWGGGANRHNTPGDYPPMSTVTRDRLSHFFQPYNEKLFSLIGERFDW